MIAAVHDFTIVVMQERSLKEENPTLYQLCKAMVLGLGFGMGPKRFKEICDRAGIVEPPSWREMITCFTPGPGRDRMFRMFVELERAGAKITMTDEATTFYVKERANLEKVRQIYAGHLPKTLKIIQHPSGKNEIVPK